MGPLLDYDGPVAPDPATNLRVIGRYALFDEIASGGVASVHLGRLLGPAGFSRTVAIKRLHPQFARDPEFLTMFVDEARLAARIRHPNVVPTLDVVSSEGEIFLVMEYFLGESFAKLLVLSKLAGGPPPVAVTCAIVASTLHGLHAAHEAKDERGEPLGIVHRDVSPQNILVGADGIARVLDFGIAKAQGRAQVTREGQVRGKMAYVAPEQFLGGKADRKADIYAASVVLWEALTGRRLFLGETEAQTVSRVLNDPVAAPGSIVAGITPALDRLVLRGLSRDPKDRHETAREMAQELEAVAPPCTPHQVADWVEAVVGAALAERARAISRIEQFKELPTPGPSTVRPRVLASAEEPTAIEYRSGLNSAPTNEEPTGTTEAFANVARNRKRDAALLLVAIGLLLLVLVMLLVRSPRPRTETADPRPRAPTPAAPPAPVVEPASSAPIPAVATVTAPAPSEVPDVPEVPSAIAPRATAPVRNKPRPKAQENCDPPYTIDEQGVRRYKMHCL
jgi:serine/threonine protein kinase